MPIDLQGRISFLSEISLFDGMDTAHLTSVAEKLQERFVGMGEVITTEGEAADHIFLIYHGSIRCQSTSNPGKETLLGDGEVIGREGGIFGKR